MINSTGNEKKSMYMCPRCSAIVKDIEPFYYYDDESETSSTSEVDDNEEGEESEKDTNSNNDDDVDTLNHRNLIKF